MATAKSAMIEFDEDRIGRRFGNASANELGIRDIEVDDGLVSIRRRALASAAARAWPMQDRRRSIRFRIWSAHCRTAP